MTFDPGSKVVQLPYVNYLRELGATFLNAYTNSPICCPSRAGKLSTKRHRGLPFKVKLERYCSNDVFVPQQCGAVSLFTSLSHGTTTSVLMLTQQHGWICWRRMDILPSRWASWTTPQGVTLLGRQTSD